MPITIIRTVVTCLMLYVPVRSWRNNLLAKEKLQVVDGKIVEEAPIKNQKPYPYPNTIPGSHAIERQGAISITIIQTAATCERNNGSIIVQATGGTPPYRFTHTDPYGYPFTRNTGNFQNLSAKKGVRKRIY